MVRSACYSCLESDHLVRREAQLHLLGVNFNSQEDQFWVGPSVFSGATGKLTWSHSERARDSQSWHARVFA